ncbi:MAG: AbrB/MazE/SpoVT family DNA-binding domain-containing protein [Candidatus Anammoxibacter sp.]
MSKVTAKYQITIPMLVRKALGIIPGSEVDVVTKGNDFVLKVNHVEDLKRVWRGKFKGKKSSDEYMEDVRGNAE